MIETNIAHKLKHVSIKWHHFCDQIIQGWLKVKKIPTKIHWADLFTKHLSQPQFEFPWNAMMGWKTPQKLWWYMIKNEMQGIPMIPTHGVIALAKSHLHIKQSQVIVDN